MNLEYTDIIKPGISDINYSGHLGHTELVNLLHEVRLRFLNQFGVTESELDGHALMVRNLNVTYKNQVFWGNNLEVKMKTNIDGAKVIFNYRIFNSTLGNETATSEIVMVLLEKKKKRLARPEILTRILKNDTNEKNPNNIITSNSIIRLVGSQEKGDLESLYHILENEFGCTYMFYIYEDLILDRKIIYTSNWDWQNRLIGEKLINECPIFKTGTEALALGKKSIILPWNNIHCKTSLEKEITIFRSEFNIANGIGISHANGIIREGIGLGADIYDYNFYLRMLEDNLIYRILKKARLVVLQNIIYPVINIGKLHEQTF